MAYILINVIVDPPTPSSIRGSDIEGRLHASTPQTNLLSVTASAAAAWWMESPSSLIRAFPEPRLLVS
jgi:hypothetical protein